MQKGESPAPLHAAVGRDWLGYLITQMDVCEVQGGEEGQGDGSAEPETFWL